MVVVLGLVRDKAVGLLDGGIPVGSEDRIGIVELGLVEDEIEIQVVMVEVEAGTAEEVDVVVGSVETEVVMVAVIEVALVGAVDRVIVTVDMEEELELGSAVLQERANLGKEEGVGIPEVHMRIDGLELHYWVWQLFRLFMYLCIQHPSPRLAHSGLRPEALVEQLLQYHGYIFVDTMAMRP